MHRVKKTSFPWEGLSFFAAPLFVYGGHLAIISLLLKHQLNTPLSGDPFPPCCSKNILVLFAMVSR